ncbi:MAG: tRNA-binding protein [Bacillota bacterium]|nr:tRNA-binding protein [Bacillota bacterium]
MLSYDEFLQVEIRVGKIIEVKGFKEAKKPAYQLKIDFGEKMGVKKSSAQLTTTYSREELLGRQVVAVTNFPPKQIGPFISEVLVLGVALENGRVPLLTVEEEVPLGLRVL